MYDIKYFIYILYHKIYNIKYFLYIPIYIFYKYISDLRKSLVKSEVERKEVKSYFVKFCRQARVELTRTT